MIHKLTRNNSLCWPRISLLSWQKNKNKYLKTTKLSFSLYVHPYFTSSIQCTFYGNTTYVRNMLISQLAVRFCDVNRISHIEETKGYKKNMVGKWGKTGLGRRKKWGLGCSTNCITSFLSRAWRVARHRDYIFCVFDVRKMLKVLNGLSCCLLPWILLHK